jgi:hypothetical protein
MLLQREKRNKQRKKKKQPGSRHDSSSSNSSSNGDYGILSIPKRSPPHAPYPSDTSSTSNRKGNRNKDLVDFARRIQMPFRNGTHWQGSRETRSQGARCQFAAPAFREYYRAVNLLHNACGIPDGIVVMHFETMLPVPALARTGKRRDTLEELDEKDKVHISQLWIIDYMRIWKRDICQDVALGALREMLPRIRLPDGYDQWQHPRILAFNSEFISRSRFPRGCL